MKRIVKCAVLTVFLTLFTGTVVCLAQTEAENANPPAPPVASVVGPLSDFDKIVPNNGLLGTRAEHWKERSSGYYLEYFDVGGGMILGWTITPSNDRGIDKWGKVLPDLTAHWSTMGWSRWASSGEVGYISSYPFTSYDYYNAWGIGGSGTMTTPASYYQGSLYESFFDGIMTGPGGATWTNDGTSSWQMVYVSDPGNYIDNRVYEHVGDGTASGWKGTTYIYGYSSSYGFSFNADVRRTDSNGDYTYGLQFFSDNPAGQTSNCYSIHLADDIYGGDHYFSVWKYTGGSATALIYWFQDPAVNPSGEWNNVKVETLNGNMEFWVNGASMGTLYDTSFTSGKIGVSFYDPDGYGSCQWDNVTVHRQPSVLVGSQGGSDPTSSLGRDTNPGL